MNVVTKKVKRAGEVAAWLVAAAALCCLLLPGAATWARLAARATMTDTSVVLQAVKDAPARADARALHASAAEVVTRRAGSPRR